MTFLLAFIKKKSVQHSKKSTCIRILKGKNFKSVFVTK